MSSLLRKHMYIQKIKPPFFAYHLNYYFTFIPFTFKHFARKPRLDLACGQGNAAKACLQERLPYTGFVLSEAHGRRLESLLTNFICEQMKQEGSPHYRPEACSQQEEETDKQNKRPRNRTCWGRPQKKTTQEEGRSRSGRTTSCHRRRRRWGRRRWRWRRWRFGNFAVVVP